MKGLKLSLFVGFLFYTFKVCLYGAGFELPAGTPGLDGHDVLQNDTQGRNVNCKHVHIPNTNCHLYFPTDGSQPDTPEAGQWSGAGYVGMPNDDLVTDWWIRVFGGNRAMDAVFRRMNWGNLLHIVPVPIIRVRGFRNFKQQSWQAFQAIAADPVGRVLLYRLLIEIRRVNNAEHGCCGDDVILPRGYNLARRNNCRSIEICSAQAASFNSQNHTIKFSPDNTVQTTILVVDRGRLTTRGERRMSDIALFHEMLHWFHWLRNPKKQTDNKSLDPKSFRYAMRCYYGDPSDLCAWGNINAEEIATILGSPKLSGFQHPYFFNNRDLIHHEAFTCFQPNSIVVQICGRNQYIRRCYKFLNGDDLSENAYRASRGHHMRFGHVSAPINPVSWPNPPDRFRLAHKVAYDCYQAITGNPPPNWDLVQG